MARPTYYPDWATETVQLPGTGNSNKIRPKETIRNVGMDFGQIMTCEELNWTLNNIGLWVRYFVDEFMPTLPTTYLPIVGTKITLGGDLSGEVTWNGDPSVNLSAQVANNSHLHLSANITDATDLTATPNVLVKRDGGGGITVGDLRVVSSTMADYPTIFLRNFSGQNVGYIESQPGAGGVMQVGKKNPTNGATTALINLWDSGIIELTNPHTSSGQSGNGNALVRFDYLNQRLNEVSTNLQNNINNVQWQLQTNLNNVQAGLQNQITNNWNWTIWNVVRDVRLGAEGFYGASNDFRMPWGCVVTGLNGWKVTSANFQLSGLYYRPIQKYVNDNWYTVGQV
ncbi:hypothetical protein [Citrobacter phage Tr1]|nr:hypothetical protein [Citrobacter phage Tr1]